jgi:hypothetical protein
LRRRVLRWRSGAGQSSRCRPTLERSF